MAEIYKIGIGGVVYDITTAPAVEAVPAVCVAIAGATATFTVAASVAGTPAFQWQYMAPGGTTWANTGLTGNKTDTLSVSATAGRDGYAYRCRITGDSETIYSAPALLTVI